jgi:hypothetical protein
MILRARLSRAWRIHMFWLLTLPFRLFFGLVFGLLLLPFAILLIPFILLRVAVKAVVLLIALPFALLAVGFGLLLAGLAVVSVLMIPLLPIAFVVFCVWAFVRLVSRPALSY